MVGSVRDSPGPAGRHASKFTSEVLTGLLRIGFIHHQQIIWDKQRTVLTRTLYWFQQRCQLDRLYQRVIDDLDKLMDAVGLKAA